MTLGDRTGSIHVLSYTECNVGNNLIRPGYYFPIGSLC